MRLYPPRFGLQASPCGLEIKPSSSSSDETDSPSSGLLLEPLLSKDSAGDVKWIFLVGGFSSLFQLGGRLLAWVGMSCVRIERDSLGGDINLV